MVTASQMLALEEEMLASGFSVEALMEKVGEAMASWLLQQKGLFDYGAFVLVGPGHNGGDGLVLARELQLAGIEVRIWCPLQISKSLTINQLSNVKWLGVKEVVETPDVSDKAIWIEALFGLGQTRELPDSLQQLLKERQSLQPDRLISLDVPAGICSDSGRSLCEGVAVARSTLTAGFFKTGLLQDLAYRNVGKLQRVEMGFPKFLLERFCSDLPRVIWPKDLKTVPWPNSPINAMKYERGKVLVVAGSKRYRGAAFLALKGVLASGAGCIHAALAKDLADNLWQLVPEVIFGSFSGHSEELSMDFGDWIEKEDLSRFDSLLIGPGLGNSNDSWSIASKKLGSFEGLLVLDADGLNRLAISEKGWRWLKLRNGPTWLTPHLEEFRRLFPEIDSSEPLKAAAQAARLTGASVLLKGAHSVVADPLGEIWQLGETIPWVARAGFGDLLAGYSAGIGSIGMSSSKPCNGELLALAAFMHSEAARLCQQGSSASCIAKSLEALTRSMQAKGV